MKDNNNTKLQLLKNPDIFPYDEVLKQALGKSYVAYKIFTKKLSDFNIEIEWRYYNDGKAWLAKGVCRKKTVFWLSVWEDFFKISLFFTEKNRSGIQELPIDNNIKTLISNEHTAGKLVPLIIDIYSEIVFNDLFTLVNYKRNIKY